MSKFSSDIANAVREYIKDPIFLARMQYKASGRIFWVKKSTSTDYTNFVKEHPAYEDAVSAVYTTITSAIAVASVYDVVLVTTGEYDEGATLTITQQGLKLIGVNSSGFVRGGAVIFGYSATHDLIHVKADDVEISHIAPIQYKAAKGIVIAQDSWGLNTWRTHIHHCYFNAGSTGTYGIWFGGTGTEAVSTLVEHCHFQEWQTAAVRMNGGASTIRDCFFSVPADAIGIEDVPDTTSRPYRNIFNNRFAAISNSTSTGIKVTNTPTAGHLMIDGNHFIVFGSNDLCITKRSGYCGLNYIGITAIAIT